MTAMKGEKNDFINGLLKSSNQLIRVLRQAGADLTRCVANLVGEFLSLHIFLHSDLVKHQKKRVNTLSGSQKKFNSSRLLMS